jgi:hypothetical protein
MKKRLNMFLYQMRTRLYAAQKLVIKTKTKKTKNKIKKLVIFLQNQLIDKTCCLSKRNFKFQIPNYNIIIKTRNYLMKFSFIYILKYT